MTFRGSKLLLCNGIWRNFGNLDITELRYTKSMLIYNDITVGTTTLYNIEGVENSGDIPKFQKVAKQYVCAYIYIDMQYTGNDSNGSVERPYRSAKDALDKAECILREGRLGPCMQFVRILALSPCVISTDEIADSGVGNYIILGSSEYSRIQVRGSMSMFVYGLVNCDVDYGTRYTLWTRYIENCLVQGLRLAGGAGMVYTCIDSVFTECDVSCKHMMGCSGSFSTLNVDTLVDCDISVEMLRAVNVICDCGVNVADNANHAYAGDVEVKNIFNTSITYEKLLIHNIYNDFPLMINGVAKNVDVDANVYRQCRYGWHGAVVALVDDASAEDLRVNSTLTVLPIGGGGTHAYCDIAKYNSATEEYTCLSAVHEGDCGDSSSSSSPSSPSPSASSPSSPSPSASSPSPSASSPSPSASSPSSSGGGGGCKLEEAKFSVIAKHKTVGGIFSYTYTMQDEDAPDPLIEYWAVYWHGYKGDQYFEPISGDAYFNFCQSGAPEGVSLEVIRQGMQEAADEIYNANLNAPWENGGLDLDGRVWGPNDSQGEFVIKGKGSYTIPYWAFTGNELYYNTSNPAQCFGEIKLESVTEGVTSVTVRIGGVVEYELAVGETLDWTALEPFYPFGPLPKPVVGSCVWEPEEFPEDRTEWPDIFNVSDETYPWGNVGERFDLKIEIVGYSCKKVKSVAPVVATNVNAYNNALPEDLK